MGKATPISRAQGARLRAAREAAGYRSARAAALDHGWPESTYRAHENGTRTIGQDDAERYARIFRTKGVRFGAESILFGQRGTERPARIVEVPLVSWVSAGQLADNGTQVPVDQTIPFSDLGSGEFFALRVQGDSMDRISPEGSLIVVNRAERRLEPNKPFVFSVRGETTYKLWRPDPPSLFPFSTNPMNEPIFPKRKRDWEVVGRVRRTVLDL